MDWINTVNGLIALITGLAGLIGTGIGVFFSIRNFVRLAKEKSAKELWVMIMSMADAAMQEAEASLKSGEDKKKMAMDIVKAGCESQGIEISDFLDQLSAYIDQSISFINSMKKK